MVFRASGALRSATPFLGGRHRARNACRAFEGAGIRPGPCGTARFVPFGTKSYRRSMERKSALEKRHGHRSLSDPSGADRLGRVRLADKSESIFLVLIAGPFVFYSGPDRILFNGLFLHHRSHGPMLSDRVQSFTAVCKEERVSNGACFEGSPCMEFHECDRAGLRTRVVSERRRWGSTPRLYFHFERNARRAGTPPRSRIASICRVCRGCDRRASGHHSVGKDPTHGSRIAHNRAFFLGLVSVD